MTRREALRAALASLAGAAILAIPAGLRAATPPPDPARGLIVPFDSGLRLGPPPSFRESNPRR